MWAPLGDLSIGVGVENATTYPHPGEVLWYPGGVSETELLVAYGRTHFASKAGPLAGNHFLTITEGVEQLADDRPAGAVARCPAGDDRGRRLATRQPACSRAELQLPPSKRL